MSILVAGASDDDNNCTVRSHQDLLEKAMRLLIRKELEKDLESLNLNTSSEIKKFVKKQYDN